MTPHLFSPIQLRNLEIMNRVWVSPMCQYSSENGFANEWHLVHLGSRAVGGAGLVIVEATAVLPEGRISPADTGIWSDEHLKAFQPITAFLKAHGAVAGIQLAHAGRKASTDAPWRGGRLLSSKDGGWTSVAPSTVPFKLEWPAPVELTHAEMDRIGEAFVQGAKRSLAAGFQVVELHMAHGYLLHEFLSPLSNQRKDSFGGSLENRMRFPLEVAKKVRNVWPSELPLFVRISASDWAEGGWDVEQSVVFVRELKKMGVDLIDCSSGGLVPYAKIDARPGYQVPFAEKVRREAGIPVAAVGLITDPKQANAILEEGKGDAVLLGREFLRDPYWPLHAANALGIDVPWPNQYLLAKI